MMPSKFEVAEGSAVFNAVMLELDENKLTAIKRLIFEE